MMTLIIKLITEVLTAPSGMNPQSRMIFPSATTAAAVSSHDVSIPRIFMVTIQNAASRIVKFFNETIFIDRVLGFLLNVVARSRYFKCSKTLFTCKSYE